MQGWFVARHAAADRRAIPGGHVSNAVTDIALAAPPADSLLQSGGDVGGMLMAGVIVVVLGLTAVAVWHGHVNTVLSRVREVTGIGAGTSAESATDAADAQGADAGTVDKAAPEVPELTDKEVIVDILEDNDGRMKQARIVDATGWSKSKVSMLLSEMEDDGDITKLRVGRENIISLSGNEPDAAGSPFDSQ